MYPQLYHPSNIVGKAEINLSVISGAHGTPGVAGASAGNIAGDKPRGVRCMVNNIRLIPNVLLMEDGVASVLLLGCS